jgi:predicted enzyme related to lactoylglutathione lyase/catechol 2,3-dioxygenase-like lactoylglutathione lyase family enzyme
MKRILILALALVAGRVVVHGAAAEALTYDHIHLAFPDTRAATEWYIKYLGATARPDGMDGVFFGPIRFNMRKAAGVVGSRGSTIEAVGLSYANLQDRLRIVLDNSGAKLVQPQHEVEGVGLMAVIEDPWGTKIELVQDPQLLGFHHARVSAVDPAAMRAWFVEKVGAQPGAAGSNALKLGGIGLIIDKSDMPPRASDGTTLDHLGFRTKDIKTEIDGLQAGGVKVLGAPRQDPAVATTFATFFEAPTGRIELTQR